MMSFRGNVGWIVEINRIGTEELEVEWQIPSILQKPAGNDYCYCSPEFSNGEERWVLRLWPKWMNVAWDPASGWMKLRLLRISDKHFKTFHIKVGIKGSRGVEKATEVEKEFSRFGVFDWEEFCSRFALTEHGSRLLINGTLTITCVIKTVAFGSAKGNGELFPTTFQGSKHTTLYSIKQQAFEEALGDFGKLLASEENTDVTVQVGDVEFRVHRLILSARSPVFSAMFRHKTEEQASNKIIIGDCEPEVFKDYLQYLYTGSVEHLSPQKIFSLYQVADKYLADNLKQLCLKHMQDGINSQTFFDTLQLSLMHGESYLLDKAIGFATENIFLNSFYLKQNL